MHVTIKLFAQFREAAGAGKMERELETEITVGQLLDLLQAEYPRLGQTGKSFITSVNQKFVPLDKQLQEGDEIAIFPPVSGGINRFRITKDAINVDDIVTAVSRPHTGAVAAFVGVVRDRTDDRAVDFLEYEAYEEMALSKMAQIAVEARQQWPAIEEVAIVQRIGHLNVGQIAAVIAVSSSHRNDGCFEACRYAIDRLKEIVPVWKKEVGPEGQAWIEGDHIPHTSD